MGLSDWLGRLVTRVRGPDRPGEAPERDAASAGSDGDGRVRRHRVHADRDGDFVVFHIGMRVNALWKVHRWLPIALVAPRIVGELEADPDAGLLGSRTVVGPGLRNVGFVQYWRSFEDLRASARDSDRLHVEAWREYTRGPANDEGAVGIWHETYLVADGAYETVYNDMPPFGLAATDGTDVTPATGPAETAAGRIGERADDDAPVP
jgi:hypothetical protein